MNKRIVAASLVTAMAVTMCTGASTEAEAAVKTKKITLTAKKKTLYTGERYTLGVKKVTPKKASKKVKYKSNKKKVASVSAKGVIKAKKKGTAKITVVSKANKKVKAVCKIKVKNGVKNKSIKLNQSALALNVGQKSTLKIAQWTPKKTASKKVESWKSSDKKVVTVSKKGEVTALAAGTATITVTNTYGKKAKCTVTVTDAPVVTSSAAPSATPVVTPSAEPTVAPTAEPTVAPTAEPTVAPTAEPTIAPTAEPTVAPTAEPTVVPTAEPTVVPTAEPTAVPTAKPTVAPTAKPTVAPTTAPTVVPTAAPVVEPTISEDGTTATYELPSEVEALEFTRNGETVEITKTQIERAKSLLAKSPAELMDEWEETYGEGDEGTIKKMGGYIVTIKNRDAQDKAKKTVIVEKDPDATSTVTTKDYSGTYEVDAVLVEGTTSTYDVDAVKVKDAAGNQIDGRTVERVLTVTEENGQYSTTTTYKGVSYDVTYSDDTVVAVGENGVTFKYKEGDEDITVEIQKPNVEDYLNGTGFELGYK